MSGFYLDGIICGWITCGWIICEGFSLGGMSVGGFSLGEVPVVNFLSVGSFAGEIIWGAGGGAVDYLWVDYL